MKIGFQFVGQKSESDAIEKVEEKETN
jgi:hypothetical protein